MNSIDALFFDVGNTLIFADHPKTLAPLWERGVRPSPTQLLAAERVARQELDLLLAKTRKVDQQYWETYYGHLLSTLGITDISLRLQLVSLARTSGNWTQVLPGTQELLQRLRRKYRLAVISNSDGGMARLLDSRGLGQCFEAVIDSGSVGHEKPAPEIFRAALDALAVAPKHSVYIGDIYSVDYLGARNAGMHAILMDQAGVYATRNLPRIESLNELEPRLDELAAKLRSCEAT
jgi:putative hydrolase of the HAD superfamily